MTNAFQYGIMYTEVKENFKKRKELNYMDIYGIKKDGQEIVIGIEPNYNRAYRYNIVTNELFMPTGKKMVHMSKALLNAYMYGGAKYRLYIKAIERAIDTYSKADILKLEMFLPNIDILGTGYIYELPDTLPKGYIQWLRENGLEIHKNTLARFEREGVAKTFNKEDVELLELLRSKINENYYSVFIKMTAEQRLAFRQIFKTTAKELVWDFKSDTCGFLASIRDEIFPENWAEIVDPNRNYEYNRDLISDWENKERNDKACEWQNNFKFLEQIDNNKLVVVVPTDMSAFHAESRMQNNCVSYYYHDDMADHEQIIYFIRKKEKPNKSYITNRFDVSDGYTAESRAVNNRDYTDPDVTDLINVINKMIREKLEELKEEE